MSRLEKLLRREFARFTLGKPLFLFFGVLCLALLPAKIPAWAAPVLQDQGGSAPSASGISVQYSEQLFAMMCALDAAGFQSDESTLSEMPARLALRDRMLKMQGPATDALRKFYADHEMADPSQTLSRYITFALVAGPPPDFHFQMEQEALPPDVLGIEDFQDILSAFYQEAHLELRWVDVRPEYERAVESDEAPVRNIVTVANAYLREITRPLTGRSFTVYVEPLVGDFANFRNFGDHYSIVIGTGSRFPTDNVRHAYLHFVLDPLPLKYRNQLQAKSALLNIAARAPLLPVQYQSDFVSFADECFIKAVELRIENPPPAQLEKVMADDDASGYILVHPFVAQLMKFEKAEPAMTYYFPDLIAGLDVAAEQKRLQSVKFAPVGSALESAPASLTESHVSPLDTEIALANRDIALRNGAAAAEKFQAILLKHPGEPRAVYGLAVASVLTRDVDQAKDLFEQVIGEASDAAKAGKPDPVDPETLAWSHVYLGRIFDLEEDPDSATQEFQAALAVRGAPEAARVAAQKALNASNPPPAPPGGSGAVQP